MQVTISEQSLLFLGSCAIGCGFGLIYDIFRILRLAIKTNKFVIVFEDILFFIICAVITFFYMLLSNQGQVRVLVLIGEFLGFIIYYYTVGKVVFKLSEIIINFFKQLFKWIFKIVSYPFLLIYKILHKYFSKIINKIKIFLKKTSTKTKLSLKHKRMLLYNLFKSKNIGKNKVRKERSKNVQKKKKRTI